jgi:AcrR family transcriptional regulator
VPRKHDNRPAQIVEEATRLFSRDGFKKVTVKQLARACGITEPALYRHFESKDKIYEAVLDSLESRLINEAIFKQYQQVDQLDQLLSGLAENILSFYQKNEDIYRLLLYSALEGHERAKKVYALIRGRHVEFLIGRLDYLFQMGRIRKKNNEITARCFIGMVFDCALGFTLWKGMQGRMYKPEEVISNNIPIYIDGLKK